MAERKRGFTPNREPADKDSKDPTVRHQPFLLPIQLYGKGITFAVSFSSFFSHSILNCRLWQLTISPKVRSLCKVRGELLPFVLDSRFASNTRWQTRVVGLSFQPQVKPVLAGLKATAGGYVAIFGRLRT